VLGGGPATLLDASRCNLLTAEHSGCKAEPETTPLVAQRRGRRLRGLVVSPLRAEQLNTDNLQPILSRFEVRSSRPVTTRK
jgi:hypothetical protein